MSMLAAVVVAACLYGVIRLLNLASPSFPPDIYAKTRNSEFVQAIISSCPILREPYVPPLLWGKSGHLQTIVYARLGRMRDTMPSGVRYTKTLSDGSTLTFDIYEPTDDGKASGQCCLLVCPGFGSSSESAYIRALTHHAQAMGYRVAVLNHLGSLKDVRLTSPRIFSYGGWEEFHLMRREVERMYPHCKLVVVGLSMGANIVLKYLGETQAHQEGISCAISICQGYNINAAKNHLLKWENLRRGYLYVMTANHRHLLRNHGDILFDEQNRCKFGFDLKKIFSATTLEELDVQFTCKLQGCSDVVAYYEKNSCSNYLGNIKIPLVMLNAEDDPIVPPPLLKYAKDCAGSLENVLFVTTKHGGHLGYFEGGHFQPQEVTWMDRFVIEMAEAIIRYVEQKGMNFSTILPSLQNEKWETPVGDAVLVKGASVLRPAVMQDGPQRLGQSENEADVSTLPSNTSRFDKERSTLSEAENSSETAVQKSDKLAKSSSSNGDLKLENTPSDSASVPVMQSSVDVTVHVQAAGSSSTINASSCTDSSSEFIGPICSWSEEEASAIVVDAARLAAAELSKNVAADMVATIEQTITLTETQ